MVNDRAQLAIEMMEFALVRVRLGRFEGVVSSREGHTVVLLPSLIDAMYRPFHEKVVRFLTIIA